MILPLESTMIQTGQVSKRPTTYRWVCTFLRTNIISWSTKKHPTVSNYSTEVEYITLSLVAKALTWINSLLVKLVFLAGYSNLSVFILKTNTSLHSRSKHFRLDYHYVQEIVALGTLVVKHIPTSL